MKAKVTVDVLKTLLKRKEVNFYYEKLDGTLREARGTTYEDYIPDDVKPKGNQSHAGVPYYDLDVNQWRSVAEGKKVYLEVTPEESGLSNEEIEFLTWIYFGLDESWRGILINAIISAPDSEIPKLMLAYPDFVKVCCDYHKNFEYAEEIRNKWNKIIGNYAEV